MDKRKLFEIALRALTRCTEGSPPAQADVEVLRQYAPAPEKRLPPDELACRFVRRGVEHGKVEREKNR